MVRNYIITAIRALNKSRAIAIINAVGLALGLASSFFIILFVQDELSFDKHHRKSERIYRLAANVVTGGIQRQWAFLITDVFQELRKSLPEIESSTAFNHVKSNQETIIVGHGSEVRNFEKTKGILIADSSFFSVFDHKFLAGNPASSLRRPNQVVLTKSEALKLFGTEKALGKSLEIENLARLQVSGVIEDIPLTSHFSFKYLVSMETLPNYLEEGTLWAYSYVVFAEETDVLAVKKRIPKLLEETLQENFTRRGTDYSVNLQPLEDIHLGSKVNYELSQNGDLKYVIAFGIVAGFILFIAYLNFVNLSTARATLRSKEVGLRKVLGAQKKQLIRQFLIEASLSAGLGIIGALVLVYAALPYLNQISGKQFTWEIITQPPNLAYLGVLYLLTTFLAGLYPATQLAALNPITSLKGILKTKTGGNIRKYLVTTQFSISVALIICTQVVLHQINYMHTKSLGFDKGQLLVIPMEKGQPWKTYNLLKDQLRNLPQVANAAYSASIPGRRQNRANMSLTREGADGSFIFHSVYVDFDFLDTYGIEIIEGRNFKPELAADTTNFLMNGAAKARFHNKGEILGMELTFPGGRIGGKVIGVFNDIYFKTLRESVEPMIITGLTSELPFDVNYLSVRLTGNQSNPTGILKIEEAWHSVYPDKAFNYFFLADDLRNQYQSEHQMSELLSIFSGLAIFIACLGLFGLSTFIIRLRIKEVGIRKVLGASSASLIVTLSKEFTGSLLLANVIAWAGAFVLMTQWMENFAHRPNMPWYPYLLATLTSFLIAWATIFNQTRKATLSNPASVLRSE